VDHQLAPAVAGRGRDLDPGLLQRRLELRLAAAPVTGQQQGAAQRGAGLRRRVERRQGGFGFAAEDEAAGLDCALAEGRRGGAVAGPALQRREGADLADEGLAGARRAQRISSSAPAPRAIASRARRPPSPSPSRATRGAAASVRSQAAATPTASTQASSRFASVTEPVLSPQAGRSKRRVGWPAAASRSAQRRRLR